MELERENSTPSYVDEKDGSLGKTSNLHHITTDNEIVDLGSGEHVQVKTSLEMNGIDTPSKWTESPSGLHSLSPPPTTKGYGLKKWRRIRRDFSNDRDTSVDFNRILKRGLSNATETPKPRDPSSEIKQISEGSVASVDSLIRSPGVSSGFVIKSSSLDSRLAVGSAFPVGTDSENSEDQSSSKSSTAASTPNFRFVNPVVMVSTRDKSKAKNPSGKNSANAVQRAQLGKGRIDTSKKLRGERVKIEKGSSFSSVESDLRSTNVIFSDIGSFSGINNARQRERSSNYDGENSYERQMSDQQYGKEVRMAYFKYDGGEAKYVSQDDEAANLSWEAKEEESDNHRLSTSGDPLIESIVLLQAVQEALEKEIQIFRDLGKEPILLPGDSTHLYLSAEFGSVDSEICEHYSSGQLRFKETEKNGSMSPEAELIELNQKVNFLERKLEKALITLEVGESRIVELEGILSKSGFPDGQSGSTQLERCREMEIELDDLFKQKIEAEVECLAITRTTQKLKVATEDHIVLLEEPKSLGMEQNQILDKHRNAENDIVVPRKQGELDSFGAELVNMHSRVCKHSFCFLVQLTLLCLALGLFLLPLLPHFTGTVPT